jgi:hypothetical protein
MSTRKLLKLTARLRRTESAGTNRRRRARNIVNVYGHARAAGAARFADFLFSGAWPSLPPLSHGVDVDRTPARRRAMITAAAKSWRASINEASSCQAKLLTKTRPSGLRSISRSCQICCCAYKATVPHERTRRRPRFQNQVGSQKHDQ